MNNTLNNRINSNLTPIVKSYNLPSNEIIKKYKEKYLDELDMTTSSIWNALHSNICYDYKGNYCSMKNTTIKRMNTIDYDYWTIKPKY